MDNPILRARLAEGLSRNDLAILASVDYALVQQNETGRVARPSKLILTALERLGYGRDEVARQYFEWRKARAAEVVAARSVGMQELASAG